MIADAVKTLLLIGNDPAEARRLHDMLQPVSTAGTTLLQASNLTDARVLLARYPIDVILLDHDLPDVQDKQTLCWLKTLDPRPAIIILTAPDHEDSAAETLHQGAQDYLIKGQIDQRSFLRSLRYAATQKQMENMAQQISHSATHDDLTGLPNTVLLKERIHLELRRDARFALLYLDVDGFRRINDALGHATGDKLLQTIAARLLCHSQPNDTISRQGSDKFIVLLTDTGSAENAAARAERVISVLSDTYHIAADGLNITASAGISLYPDDGSTANDLIRNAEAAMYQAKDLARHRVRFFEPAVHTPVADRQFSEDDLRRALDNQEFTLHYQPKIALCTKNICGAEALIRWDHPIKGLISPDQFIPLAEDCNLILPIGEWIMYEACQQTQRWAASGVDFGTMAVNISAIQLQQDDFAQRVFSNIDKAGITCDRLELELTESVLMTGENAAAIALQTVRGAGVQVALDDFGTGYSSLSYLEKFPVDCLKIDRSFIRLSAVMGRKNAIVAAIITMAHTLGLRVIAEGVETKAQLDFITDRGCDVAQGYYFSHPLKPCDFSKYVQLANAQDLTICSKQQV